MRGNSYKVGIVVNSLNYGGNERSAINIAKNLPGDFDATIIIQESIESIPYDGKVISLDLPCKEGFFGKAVNSIRRLLRLKKIIKDNHFDCLLIILPITNIINYSQFDCKKIVSCREYGDLVNHPHAYKEMTKKSDMIVFNSVEQQSYFVRKNPELSDRTTTIYNILDVDGIKAKAKDSPEKNFIDFTQGKKTIVSVGRFAEQKAFCHLLKSFRLVVNEEPDARLVMIGDGKLRSNIEDLIHKLDLDKVVLLLGFKQDLHKYVANSMVFTLTSYSEGFPNVLIEALACGTAVVATDCSSGPLEILAPGELKRIKDGYQISEYGIRTMEFDKDENAWNPAFIYKCHEVFAQAILVLLQDVRLREEYEIKGLARAESFRKDVIIKQWESLFQ